jgi:glycerophosphoryl diester phosphodiesterase
MARMTFMKALGLGALGLLCGSWALAKPIVIAHRGASGHLPEHTLAAAALAHAQGADFIEQDVLLTKDGQLVVLHDRVLDAVTNVAQVFSGRARADGLHHVIDFTLAELRTLSVVERLDAKTGKQAYPLRYLGGGLGFRIATLGEHIALIKSLNTTRQKKVGVYIEFKDPAGHRKDGHDIGAVLFDELRRHGLHKADGPMPLYVQCFDATELKSFRERFKPAFPLIQLVGQNSWRMNSTDYDAMQSPAGLAEVKSYASGIGPWIPQVLGSLDAQGNIKKDSLLEAARRLGLAVHPYTFRTDDLPKGQSDPQKLLATLFLKARIDGIFTDQADAVVGFLGESRGR